MDQTGQTANQIESYIEDKRSDLGSNLQELEQKVRSATDWQQYFRKNPLTMLGVAFGGGILLATMAGRRSHGVSYNRTRNNISSNDVQSASDSSGAKDAALEAWDTIKGAVIGVAATRFKQYAEEILPGFGAQYDKVAQSHGKAVPV